MMEPSQIKIEDSSLTNRRWPVTKEGITNYVFTETEERSCLHNARARFLEQRQSGIEDYLPRLLVFLAFDNRLYPRRDEDE